MFLLPGGPDDSDAAGLPAPTGLPPGSGSLGDVRTADPCALADLAALSRYGVTRLEPDWGGFERCDVFVEPAPGNEVDVKIEFDAPELGEPEPDTTEDVGVGRLIRGQDDGVYCDRILLLLDGNQLGITAEEGEPHANRCGIAEAAMQHAISGLRRGELPRRPAPFAPNSLALLDACALVRDATLSRVVGLDPTTAEREYAGWMCQWDGRTDDTWAEIRFERNVPYSAGDGDPVGVGDREARVEAPGYHPEGCTIKVVHRPYRDADGDTSNEVVLVSVMGTTAPPEQFCGPATELAEAVAAALPPVPR
jgi:eukaryotic-like serine/threonine-protein kinase